MWANIIECQVEHLSKGTEQQPRTIQLKHQVQEIYFKRLHKSIVIKLCTQ